MPASLQETALGEAGALQLSPFYPTDLPYQQGDGSY